MLVQDSGECTTERKKVTYNGADQYIKFEDFVDGKMTLGTGGLSRLVGEHDENNASLVLYGRTVTTYTITFALTSNYKWSTGDSETKVFYFEIAKLLLANPTVQEGNIFDDQGNTLPELQREVFDFSSATGSGIRIYVTYTGKPISLRVSNCSLGPQLTVTGTTRGLEYVYNDDGTTTITATNVGNYMFRVRLNQYNVYDWQGGLVGNSSNYDRAVFLRIMPKEIDGRDCNMGKEQEDSYVQYCEQIYFDGRISV